MRDGWRRKRRARLKRKREARLKRKRDTKKKCRVWPKKCAWRGKRPKRKPVSRPKSLKAEEEARLKAEEEARRKAEEEARLKAEEEARRKAEEEARLKAEEVRKAREKAELEAARLKAEEDERRKIELEEARRRAEELQAKAQQEAALDALWATCTEGKNAESFARTVCETYRNMKIPGQENPFVPCLADFLKSSPNDRYEKAVLFVEEAQRAIKGVRDYALALIDDYMESYALSGAVALKAKADALKTFIGRLDAFVGVDPGSAAALRECVWMVTNMPQAFNRN